MIDLDNKVEAFFERIGDFVLRKLSHQKHWTIKMFESHQYYPIAIRERVWETLTESQKTMALEDDYKNACSGTGAFTLAILTVLLAVLISLL